MSLSQRFHYYRRIFSAYLLPGKSHLSFWHETPEANLNVKRDELGEYYMTFAAKADFAGDSDAQGIPLLDYHGKIGLQYNPIAISQYGLGNYNFFARTGESLRREKFLAASDWLVANLEQNRHGLWVWNHHFDWDYRDTLKAPWYSGLAQGQGISLLVRAHRETADDRYRDAARRAFQGFSTPVQDGGVIFSDRLGDLWIEEYIVDPPTHILNGCIWASWGIYDYFLSTKDVSARELFEKVAHTLAGNLDRYDIGFWSLYEQSGTRLKMVASPFYHRLHIVQLRIMHQLTGNKIFQSYAERWDRYARSRARRTAALCYKSAFKLCYY
jgi:heparosan-N-sulfate-glucuronate 5-epimerase